jgi:hypothetical protein
MNYKPFDLQKALAGEQVVTRLGKKVSQLTRFTGVSSFHYPLIGVTEEGRYLYCKEDGRQSDNSNSIIDLFMAPKKKTVWVNMWSLYGRISVSPNPYESEEEALKKEVCTKDHYIGTYPIEIEI